MPPFYTYECPWCKATVEEMRPMDEAKTNRPVCAAPEHGFDVLPTMELVIQPVAGVVRNPAAGPRRSRT